MIGIGLVAIIKLTDTRMHRVCGAADVCNVYCQGSNMVPELGHA